MHVHVYVLLLRKKFQKRSSLYSEDKDSKCMSNSNKKVDHETSRDDFTSGSSSRRHSGSKQKKIVFKDKTSNRYVSTFLLNKVYLNALSNEKISTLFSIMNL